MSTPQIKQLTMDTFREMDVDNSGTISYDEFKAVMIKKAESGKADEAAIRALFDSLDVDKSGDLTIEELQKMFSK